ncbi:MAG: RecD/TraA family helicase [Idiomarinaceae bacterium HL-53]|nr:MAG: RecD/TraA family helicase [Idiomarinaceae bacterium HL-53]CUS47488.1 exodeoxyribonuclease V alpha subunit [Idiomarinaceae bacterium HL-53]
MGVEVDQYTLRKINRLQHYVVRVEEPDQTALVSTIARGMLLDITPKTKIVKQLQLKHERLIVTTNQIEILRPKGHMIVELLGGSTRFKGIGPVKAKKLWQFYGESLYDFLSDGDVKALEQQLTPVIAQRAVEAWRTYVNVDAMRYCNYTLGLKVSTSLRVSEFYQSETVQKLKEDPYRLLAFGIPFSQCDQLAFQLSYAIDANVRLSAAIEEALYQVLANGSTVASHFELTEPLRSLLKTSDNDLCTTDELVTKALEHNRDCENYVLLDDNRYQSNGAYLMESFVATRLAKLTKTPVQLNTTEKSLSEIIHDYELEKGFRLTALQREAVMQAYQHRFFIINGGAGVGKTTVLDVLYRIFQSMNIVPIQLALAGKAAKRMTEATGYESFTIARFTRVFDSKKYENMELAIVVDESSMVDLPSMYRLLKSIPSRARIIMLGDTGQLPPVDFGLVFHELIDLDFVPKVTLTEVRRQGKNSNIPGVAYSVRCGQMPNLTHHDVQHVPMKGFTAIKKLAAQLFHESYETAQVICPTNKMADGVNQICASSNNNPLVRIFIEEFDRYLDTEFRVGDKVMCCKNLYDMNVMNGSVGKVVAAYKIMKMVPVSEAEDAPEYASFGRILWDDGIEREISVEVIDALKLAYAITIHKSQGSQFGNVIVPLDYAPNLDRTMFYTALTRAEKSLTVIGDTRVLTTALAQDFSRGRSIDLSRKLKIAIQMGQRTQGS